jgi:hypothetical protein
MYGSAVADIFAMIIRVGIIIALARRLNEIGYNIGKFTGLTILILFFIGAGLTSSYTLYGNQISFMSIIYKSGVLLAYSLLAFAANRKMLVERLGSFRDELN